MKFLFIGLALFFMASAPIATQATDFRIDKIVNDALAKAQAEQATAPTSDAITKAQPTMALSSDPAKTASDTPPKPALKTLKTDPQTDQSEEN